MAKVIVIGAGPAGIMAAITAAENHKVLLIDSNEKIAKKLFITGKGRCNITNAKDIGDFLIIYQVIHISFIVLYIHLIIMML